MRGKGFRPHTFLSPPRITPAHAGKSLQRAKIAHCKWDHPRTCGEKAHAGALLGGFEGSPPHMRGKEGQVHCAPPFSRITPAHAGKRDVRKRQVEAQQDHPRTCGEKPSSLISVCSILGSPPHMRGKGVFPSKAPFSGRITPAHAGKSCTTTR